MEGLSAEVSFAQRLAGNTKKIRDRALKKLRHYMKSKSGSKKGGFNKEDLLKLWKGLHYCLWMQDKAIMQEELNTNLSQLVHNLASFESQLMFVRVFFITEAREWNSIDMWRLDKFMTLVRNMLTESLVMMKKQKWQKPCLQQLTAIFSEEVMSPTSQTIPEGLKFHFADIYWEEVEKIGANQLTGDQLLLLVEPFINYIRTAKNTTVVNRVISRIFQPVIARGVDLLKRKKAEEEVEQPETPEEGEDEETEIPLQALKFDNGLLADRLFEVSKQPDMLSRNRPLIYKLVQKLQDVNNGVIPRQRLVVIGPGVTKSDINEAAQQLAKLDKPRKKVKKKKRKNSEVEDEDSEQDSDLEEKENESFDQNNNTDSPAVNPAPVTPEATSKTAAGKQKRKLSVDTILGTDVPVEKKKKKSVDNESEKKPLSKLKKLLMPKKNSFKISPNAVSAKKSSEITLTPLSHKPDKAKHKKAESGSEGSGWTVTPVKKDMDNTDGNLSSKSKDSTVTKITKKHPPKLVLTRVENKSPKTAGKKRSHPESSNSAENSKGTDSQAETKSPSSEMLVWTDEIQDGEVEIYVPSKTYKGKLDLTPKPEFASFDKSKAPAAFVKKSVSKTPQNSAAAKKYIKGNAAASDSAKRVSFDMKKNKSQAFKDSLKSPRTPYNPYKRPDQSILKTPDAIQTPKTRKSSTTSISSLAMPVTTSASEPRPKTQAKQRMSVRMAATPTPTIISTKPIKKATPLKRAKAKDFFYL